MLKISKGFTLIELLITVSIIAILSTIGFNTFLGSQKRGRDVRRQSDLDQYRVALENYASVNTGVYPNWNFNGDVNAASGIFATTGPLAAYLTGFPADPRPTEYNYYYRSDASGLSWMLVACQEHGDTLYKMCSDGKNITGASCSQIASITYNCDATP